MLARLLLATIGYSFRVRLHQSDSFLKFFPFLKRSAMSHAHNRPLTVCRVREEKEKMCYF